MKDITDEQKAEVVAHTEALIAALVKGYRDFLARDQANGITSDEPALGGVGMVATESIPPAMRELLIPLAIRRIAALEDALANGTGSG